MLVPDRDAEPPESEGAESDWRRLLDGYAEPGRLSRLRDRQPRREASWVRGLGRWLVRGERG
jgi:hypothetical protein